MISKPDGDWYRDDRTADTARQLGRVATKTLAAGSSAVVRIQAAIGALVLGFTALMSGWGALAAGLLGANIPMGVLAGGFSLGLGWLALRSARTALGRSGRAVPEQPRGTGWRAAPAGPSAAGRVAAGILPGHGTAIFYDRKKLLWSAARLVAVCLVIGAALVIGRSRSPVAGLVILSVFGGLFWMIVLRVRRAMDTDLTAIAWDGQGLRLRTLTASRQVPWEMVKSVRMQRTTMRVWGLIPVATTHVLLFRLRLGRRSRSVGIPAAMLAVRPGVLESLLQARETPAVQSVGSAAAGDRPAFGRKLPMQPDPGLWQPEPACADVPVRQPSSEPNQGAPLPPRVFGRKGVKLQDAGQA